MRLVMNVSDRIHVLTDGHTLAGDAVAEVRAIKAVVEAISASTTPAWPLVDQILEVLCRLKREGITVLPVDQNARTALGRRDMSPRPASSPRPAPLPRSRRTTGQSRLPRPLGTRP